MRTRRTLRLAAAAACISAGLVVAGCGAGGGGGSSKTVRVLMVNNPQMVDLQKLTAANFTKQTGIKVDFKVLPENDVRDTIAQDVANQAGQYDVITISNFEKDNPDIKVNFVTLPENELRDRVTQDIATKGGQYDVVTIGTFEVPQWAKNGWIENLGPYTQ